MAQLRELVQRYLSGALEYREFRRAFVEGFLAASDNDAVIGRVYDIIESACSARDNEYVNDRMFKLKLLQLFPVVEQSQQNGNVSVFNANAAFVRVVPSMRANWLAAGNQASELPSAGSNRVAIDEQNELELVDY